MDAGASVKGAETAELDEEEASGRALVALSLWCEAHRFCGSPDMDVILSSGRG